jgi:hypothetical protein
MRYLHVVAKLVVLSGALSACASPVSGEWEGEVPGAPESSEMTLEDDGTGEASVVIPGFEVTDPETGEVLVFPPSSFEFEISWEEDGTDEYDLEMRCASASGGGTCLLNGNGPRVVVKSTCELSDDELDCKGDLQGLPFDLVWERK